MITEYDDSVFLNQFLLLLENMIFEIEIPSRLIRGCVICGLMDKKQIAVQLCRSADCFYCRYKRDSNPGAFLIRVSCLDAVSAMISFRHLRMVRNHAVNDFPDVHRILLLRNVCFHK